MSKISELSNGGALLATDDLIVVRSGGNVRAQLSSITGQSISATTLAASGAATLTSTLAVTGNVGIGITPSVKLEVNGGSDGSVVFSGRSDGGNGNNQRFNLIAFSDGGGSGYGGGLKIQTRSSSNVFSDVVTVSSSGRVLINTTSATELLNVANTAGNGAGVEFAGNGNTMGSTSAFYGQGSNSDAYVWNRANSPVLFGTNNTERMRINGATGDVFYWFHRTNTPRQIRCYF